MELIYLMMAFHFASTICIVFGFLVFLKDTFPRKELLPKFDDVMLKDEKAAKPKRKPIVMDDEKAFHMQKEDIATRRPTI